MSESSIGRTDAVIEGLGSLSVIRQIGMMLGLIGCVAVGVWIALWTKEPTFRPLYTDISNLEATQVADILQTENILFEIDTNSGILMVESDKIHNARLKLAAAGYPSGKGIGYELLDQKQSFGTSQFLEKAKYQRSLEGELSRTITSISTVRGARVHLAIPKKTVFVGDQRKPSASVLVDLFPGRSLEKGQVASIVHLVASSIPQMSSKDVTVVDQLGTLLSDNNEDEEIKLASRNLEYTKNIEKLYLERVHNILEPIIGEDRFKVEVTADIDFTRMEQTSEIYNPDLPALRSEQVLDEKLANGVGLGGIPGAIANQPPGGVAAPEQVGGDQGADNAAAAVAANNQNVRSQTARNYELDRTISHTQHQMGRVKRLSVAVVVDNKLVSNSAATNSAPDAGGVEGEGAAEGVQASTGNAQSVPLSEQEIERITMLVKDAIGYDVHRGDSVNVINQEFVGRSVEAMVDLPEPPWWEDAWLRDLVKQVSVIILVLVMMLGVIGPVLRNLAKAGDPAPYEDDDLDLDLVSFGDDDDASAEEQLTIEGGPESLLPGPDQSYEAQLTAIKNMVANDSRLVAQVVKQWVGNE